MTQSILTIDQVTKKFGGLVAIDNLSFSLKQGELLGLIGPNGSGKTTMLNLISGAFKPSSGTISLDNAQISNQPSYKIARQGVARTFQLVRVLPNLTAEQNVVAGCVFGHVKLWGDEAKQKAQQLLSFVGLAEHKDTPTSSMTYIDQKRLELARALASNPRLLLLDEWLAGLNPSELSIGINLINDIRDQGTSIIMVEHVMDAIRQLCDRCLVMSSGVKIAEGKVADVLSDPEVVRAYLGDDGA